MIKSFRHFGHIIAFEFHNGERAYEITGLESEFRTYYDAPSRDISEFLANKEKYFRDPDSVLEKYTRTTCEDCGCTPEAGFKQVKASLWDFDYKLICSPHCYSKCPECKKNLLHQSSSVELYENEMWIVEREPYWVDFMTGHSGRLPPLGKKREVKCDCGFEAQYEVVWQGKSEICEEYRMVF